MTFLHNLSAVVSFIFSFRCLESKQTIRELITTAKIEIACDSVGLIRTVRLCTELFVCSPTYFTRQKTKITLGEVIRPDIIVAVVSCKLSIGCLESK